MKCMSFPSVQLVQVGHAAISGPRAVMRQPVVAGLG